MMCECTKIDKYEVYMEKIISLLPESLCKFSFPRIGWLSRVKEGPWWEWGKDEIQHKGSLLFVHFFFYMIWAFKSAQPEMCFSDIVNRLLLAGKTSQPGAELSSCEDRRLVFAIYTFNQDYNSSLIITSCHNSLRDVHSTTSTPSLFLLQIP